VLFSVVAIVFLHLLSNCFVPKLLSLSLVTTGSLPQDRPELQRILLQIS
jgi:hypothetical protein